MHDAPTKRKDANRHRKQQADDAANLPRVGDLVGGFLLKVELGRGAFARVFLAEEVSLGHRPVALKISRAEGDEPKILARLQHAHIVPVHSVHDDPATGLRLLCMPFFGGANLAQLLQETWGLTHSQATGRSIVEALDQFSQRLPLLDGQAASLPVRRAQQVGGEIASSIGSRSDRRACRHPAVRIAPSASRTVSRRSGGCASL